MGLQGQRLFTGEPTLFFAELFREASNGDERLYLAGALRQVVPFFGYPHGAAGDRAKRVDAAGSLLIESGAGEVAELLREIIQVSLGPLIYMRRLCESRNDGFKLGNLLLR